MPQAQSDQPDAALRLPASLDATAAEALHGLLHERIEQDSALILEGEAVERVSTPCLQVLAAAAIGARARKLAFSLQAPSAILQTAANDIGFACVLGLETEQ